MSLELNCELQRDKFNLEVHLTAASGSVLAIMGENASGKTSTLDMIAGLVACTSGKISLNGQVFDDSTTSQFLQPENRGVSTVFQGGGLFSHMTVEKMSFLAAALHLETRRGSTRQLSNLIWLGCCHESHQL